MNGSAAISNSSNALLQYTLHLADNALILGHRNSEWTGHGPILEQDIAISNIALDMIGQARNFYQYAATLAADGSTENSLAFLRDSMDFKNCLLVEQQNGDWSKTILRQFFFSTYQYLLYKQLSSSTDATIAAISEKALKEVTYHLRWSSEWVIRLGDGTEESRNRLLSSLESLWKFSGELYSPADFEIALAENKIAADLVPIKEQWLERVRMVFNEATIDIPEMKWMQTGGKQGKHSEHLGFLLSEMQFLQRAYPGAEW